LLIFVPLVLAAGSASNADDERYRTEYRSFTEALAAGDRDAATSHAHAAWQAAETELGDHRTTAILAFNYGRLVVFRHADNPLVPLRRAASLQASGTGDLSVTELQIYIDYAEFAAGGFKKRQGKKLRKSLEAFDDERIASTPDAASIWLRLAASDVAAGQYRNALNSATRAEAAIASAAPLQLRERAEAILIAGIARLVPFPRAIDDVQAARKDFDRARRLFLPQADIDSFDPLLAQILAWDGAAGAAQASLLGEERDAKQREADARQSRTMPKTFAYQMDESIDCATVKWIERQAPQFPRSALRRGSIGAVFVGFRLGDDLTARDARVLAEVPVAEFGDAALSAMAHWRAAELPSGGPACHENLVSRFTFAIAN
jgi:hypothetical protein